MTLYDYYMDRIPEYYDSMYLDGYSPEQIIMASRKKMMRKYEERMAAQEAAEPYNINIKSEVKIR